jgi:hypothetical protein
MEGRMTICKMAVEAGARSGLPGVRDPLSRPPTLAGNSTPRKLECGESGEPGFA